MNILVLLTKKTQPPPLIPQNHRRCIMPRRACDPASRVGAAAAHVEALDEGAVVAVAEDGSGGEELRQAHLAVENVTADEAKFAFQIAR